LVVVCYRLLTDVCVTILLLPTPPIAVADKLNADGGRSLRRALVNPMFYSATQRGHVTDKCPLPARRISTRRRPAPESPFLDAKLPGLLGDHSRVSHARVTGSGGASAVNQPARSQDALFPQKKTDDLFQLSPSKHRPPTPFHCQNKTNKAVRYSNICIFLFTLLPKQSNTQG